MRPLFQNKMGCPSCQFLKTVKHQRLDYDVYLCRANKHRSMTGDIDENFICFVNRSCIFDSNTFSRFDRLRQGDYRRFPLLDTGAKMICNEFEIDWKTPTMGLRNRRKHG